MNIYRIFITWGFTHDELYEWRSPPFATKELAMEVLKEVWSGDRPARGFLVKIGYMRVGDPIASSLYVNPPRLEESTVFQIMPPRIAWENITGDRYLYDIDLKLESELKG